MKSVRITAALCAVLAVGATGCGPGRAGSAANRELADGRTFTMSVPSDPGTLDPALTAMSIARGIGRFLYGQLVGVTADGTMVPQLAEKWEASTTKATFTLRPGITCADGAPLTAGDVAANISFVGDPKNRSPLAGVQVPPGTTAAADEAARTVTVTSGAPDAFLLMNIGTLAIVCGEGMRDRRVLAKGGQGTGMFTVAEIVPGDHYTFVRRGDYAWGPGDWPRTQPGLPDKVVIRVIPNETTAANLVLSGQLNATAVLGADRLRLSARKLAHGDVLLPVGQLWFNQSDGHPGQDRAVRRALVQALDLAQLGKVLTNSTGKPSRGMVTAMPRPCPGDPVGANLPKHDPAAAAAALDAAGWVVGPDGVRARNGKPLAVGLLQPTTLGQGGRAAAELIQRTWQKIGVRADIRTGDGPTVNQVLLGTGAWDVSMAPVAFGLPSNAVPFVSGPTPPQGTNLAHLKNDGYTAAAKQAAALSGPSSCEYWDKAEASLVQAVDVVPYYDSVVPYFLNGAKVTVDYGVDPFSIRMFAG
ncbi:ABC transporter substrate-binding protein [Amycolatopsis samaneae]|uniref:ABC transporter substrate-binding protein n=1 Tax=Amycolatopsis samaneae TaxID=664691 RepID=A0ABW5GMG9_9PSEU